MAKAMELVSADEYQEENPRTLAEAQLPFAEEVADKLGYFAMKAQITTKVRKATGMDTLLAVLREHGVKFYRPDEVERYKRVKRNRQVRTNWLGWAIGVPGLIIALSSIVLVKHGSTSVGIPLLCVSGVACLFGLAWGIRRAESTVRATWLMKPLAQYSHEVPIEALQRAMALQEANPNLRFDVEWLNRSVVYRDFTIDPLLYVRLRDEADEAHLQPRSRYHPQEEPERDRLCIAVWDEPGFNAELMD